MILITRPQPEAGKLAELLARQGIDCLVDPMLTIQIRDFAAMNTQEVQALVFTSSNGVRAYASKNSNYDVLAVVVGEATAELARELGFKNVIEAGGNVDSLFSVICSQLKPQAGKVIHCCGAIVRGNLVERLCVEGFQAEKQVLYDAVATESLMIETVRALEAGKIDRVLFFSPRTGEIFVRLLTKLHLAKNCFNVTAVCLSAVIAEAVSHLPWHSIKIADCASTSALIDIIKRDNDNGFDRKRFISN